MNLWLYVENNPGDAELVRTLLREYCPEIQLVVAGDAEEALAFLRKDRTHLYVQNPALVLVGLYVPRMEGRDPLREIRQSLGRAAPVIVLPDLEDQSNVAHCYKAGATCVVPTPFDLEDWVATLKHLASLWPEAVPTVSERHNALLVAS